MEKKKFDLRNFCAKNNLDLRETAKILGIKLPSLTTNITTVAQAKKAFMESNDPYELMIVGGKWVKLAKTYEEICDFFKEKGTKDDAVENFSISARMFKLAEKKHTDFYLAKMNKTKTGKTLLKLYHTLDSCPDAEGKLEIPTLKKIIEVSSNLNELNEVRNELSEYEHHIKYKMVFSLLIKKMATVNGFGSQ